MGAGASGDAPLDVDDDDPDALSPKNGSMFCGGEDGTLSLFYDPGPARPDPAHAGPLHWLNPPW